MSLIVKAYAASDVGRKRKRNEDAYVVDAEIGLFAVADGMGGHSAGDVASKRAVDVVRTHIAEHAEVLRAFAADPSPVRGAAAARVVEEAIQTACADIHRMGEGDARLRGMGTTFVGLVVAGERAIVAHVGDSRLYLLRSGALHALTDDHTIVAEQMKAGEITAADAKVSPFKGVLTRAIGQHESVQVDTVVADLMPGDAFLLCSDGLYAYFGEEELTTRLGGSIDQPLADALVGAANERGGKDNITALVVSAASASAAVPASIARIDVLRSIPLFAHLTYRELNEVLAVATTKTYPSGVTVVREGAPGGDLFVVLEGEVSVEQSGTPIATVLAGGHFGEMGLVDAGPRSASVRTLAPLRAMVIHRDGMLAVMQRDATLAVKLLWTFVQVLSQRLRATNTELSEVLSSGAETTRQG